MSFSFLLILAIKRRKGEKNLCWFSKNKKIFSYSNRSLLFSVQADLASSEDEDQSFSKVRIMLAVKHRLNVQLKKKKKFLHIWAAPLMAGPEKVDYATPAGN